MILVDTALQARAEAHKPIRVGVLGAGFMAQGLTNMIVNSMPGMRLVAIYNRRPERAVRVFEHAGRSDIVEARTQSQLDEAIRRARAVVTDDAMLLARSDEIDVLVETTGSVDFGARVVLEAFAHKKDVVLMN